MKVDYKYPPYNIPEDKDKKSGFFDLPVERICPDPNHDPPNHLLIPFGKGYRHICPKCGHVTIVIPPQVSF